MEEVVLRLFLFNMMTEWPLAVSSLKADELRILVPPIALNIATTTIDSRIYDNAGDVEILYIENQFDIKLVQENSILYILHSRT